MGDITTDWYKSELHNEVAIDLMESPINSAAMNIRPGTTEWNQYAPICTILC